MSLATSRGGGPRHTGMKEPMEQDVLDPGEARGRLSSTRGRSQQAMAEAGRTPRRTPRAGAAPGARTVGTGPDEVEMGGSQVTVSTTRLPWPGRSCCCFTSAAPPGRTPCAGRAAAGRAGGRTGLALRLTRARCQKRRIWNRFWKKKYSSVLQEGIRSPAA